MLGRHSMQVLLHTWMCPTAQPNLSQVKLLPVWRLGIPAVCDGDDRDVTNCSFVVVIEPLTAALLGCLWWYSLRNVIVGITDHLTNHWSTVYLVGCVWDSTLTVIRDNWDVLSWSVNDSECVALSVWSCCTRYTYRITSWARPGCTFLCKASAAYAVIARVMS